MPVWIACINVYSAFDYYEEYIYVFGYKPEIKDIEKAFMDETDEDLTIGFKYSIDILTDELRQSGIVG